MGEISNIIPTILSWKKKFNSIFYIKIGNSEYIFKILTRGEYNTILNLQEGLKVDPDDMLLEECLLYPKFNKVLFDKKSAGEVEYLIQCIAKSSGFSETEKVLNDIERERSSTGTLDNQIIILICKAFPHLTLSDINKLTYEELIRYLAISEAILDVKLTIDKPNTQKPGTVDFDKENQVMGSVPFDRNLNKNRGDVSK